MTDSFKKPNSLALKFQDYRSGNDGTAHFSEFMDVSNSFVSAYSRLLGSGMPTDSIALAMLGATLNFYEMFGLRAELPHLLRELAEEIENNPLTG